MKNPFFTFTLLFVALIAFAACSDDNSTTDPSPIDSLPHIDLSAKLEGQWLLRTVNDELVYNNQSELMCLYPTEKREIYGDLTKWDNDLPKQWVENTFGMALTDSTFLVNSGTATKINFQILHLSADTLVAKTLYVKYDNVEYTPGQVNMYIRVKDTYKTQIAGDWIATSGNVGFSMNADGRALGLIKDIETDEWSINEAISNARYYIYGDFLALNYVLDNAIPSCYAFRIKGISEINGETYMNVEVSYFLSDGIEKYTLQLKKTDLGITW
ncbi:MAG: hypothetical protein LBO69_00825 [Ignavibacteria bacterium]|jgi:hypothetical protein|nr:hypothetical protein [Ignavibacteria bacterium]